MDWGGVFRARSGRGRRTLRGHVELVIADHRIIMAVGADVLTVSGDTNGPLCLYLIAMASGELPARAHSENDIGAELTWRACWSVVSAPTPGHAEGRCQEDAAAMVDELMNAAEEGRRDSDKSCRCSG